MIPQAGSLERVDGGAHCGHGHGQQGRHGLQFQAEGEGLQVLCRLVPPGAVTGGNGPLAWTRWEITWNPASPGEATLSVRATDSAGNVQPTEVAWNKFGYQMNAILNRRVRVV